MYLQKIVMFKTLDSTLNSRWKSRKVREMTRVWFPNWETLGPHWEFIESHKDRRLTL